MLTGLRPMIPGFCAVGIVVGLKAFYSGAGATELLWILAPSAWLARFIGGIDLVYEEGAGFISHEHQLVVGAACAGVNFLVISFLCVYFAFVRHFENGSRWLLKSLLICFGATVAANGLRIFISAHLWTADIYGGWLTRELAHRVAGTGIYYASLLALYFVLASCIGARAPTASPLLWYLGVTLGVPLAGRILAEGSPGFAWHATWVLAVTLLITAVKLLPSAMRNRIH